MSFILTTRLRGVAEEHWILNQHQQCAGREYDRVNGPLPWATKCSQLTNVVDKSFSTYQ